MKRIGHRLTKKRKKEIAVEAESLTVTELFRSCVRDSLAVLNRPGVVETVFPSPEMRADGQKHIEWAAYHLECLRALASAQIVQQRSASHAKPPNSPGGLAS